jgi:hypothetical protein
MFDYIQTVLQEDAESGQRHFMVADFDATDGHPIRFVRRLRGSHDRIEWRVHLRPLTTSEPVVPPSGA